ncbi:MAG: DUF6316 family protein [Pseudomonadales bacterium]
MRRSDAFRGLYHRSRERVFCQEWEWFVETREGRRGPFLNRNAAHQELLFYVETMAFLEAHKARLPANILLTEVDLVNMDRPAGWTDTNLSEVPVRPLHPGRSNRRR